jgi:hypothetical protein
MKKILLSAACIGLSYLSHAQISFGVKGGLNLSTVGGKDVSGTSSLVGFHGGVQASIPLKGEFHLQSELFYSAEGAKMKVEADGDGDQIIETNAKAHLNYINLPVLLQYRHASGFFAETGPQLGYLLSAKLKAGGESTDLKDSFKKTNLSWVLGAGYLIADGKIGFDLRYNFGISGLAKGADGEPAGKAYSRGLQAGVFYRL